MLLYKIDKEKADSAKREKKKTKTFRRQVTIMGITVSTDIQESTVDPVRSEIP